MKICRKCNAEFDARACPACNKRKCIKWRADNPEKMILNHAKWYEENKGRAKAAGIAWAALNKEKSKAIKNKYAAANRDKLRAYNFLHRKMYPEKVKVSRAAWLAANPDFKRINSQNRRALKKASGAGLSRGLAEKLFKLQKGECPCCGNQLGKNFHLDHIMPLALGGVNEDWNIQLLRQQCNNQKSAKHPVDFMQSRGKLL